MNDIMFDNKFFAIKVYEIFDSLVSKAISNETATVLLELINTLNKYVKDYEYNN
jgi:hypothetical protein